MGFYGNITNTAKTQFTFDRTYPNRKTMESRIATDEIYLGRYVLVEYDLTNKETLDTFLQVQRNATTNYFYLMGAQSEKNRVRYTEKEDPNNPGHGLDNAVVLNQLVYVVDEQTKAQTFYRCTGSAGGDGLGSQYAAFSVISVSENNYTQNYNIDMSVYGEGRGYDSTVWQKVYSQGAEKFVMIAELNTVVPTFDIVADAPTMTPLTPHFDANSTNVYYKLHWQPQWGMRIARAANDNSDVTTSWLREIYIPETGRTSKEYFNAASSTWVSYSSQNPPTAANNVPAAIYWNNDALAAQVDENRTSDNGIKKTVSGDNSISILPTGRSGKTYPLHDGTGGVKESPDIQEFKINLPIIGNIASNAYDIIHGPYRNNSPADSLQGRLNFFKNMEKNEIPVQSPNGYLVGSTITGDDWIAPVVNVSAEEGYHQDAITVMHLYNPEDPTNSNSNLNESTEDTLELYVPNVDSTGHIVGYNTETVTLPYGYKSFEIDTQSSAVTELTANTAEVIANNTKDKMVLSSANKWIRLAGEEDKLKFAHAISKQIPITVGNETKSPKFGESFTIPRFTTDEAGHIVAASDQTITLQQGSYTPATNISKATEVITSIGFDATTGDITSTKADSSTLTLASYAVGTNGDEIENGDTYNLAFAKLQNQINNLDYSETNTTQIITGVSQVDGKISVNRGDIGTLVLGTFEQKEDATDLAKNDTLNIAFSKLQKQIHNEEVARDTAIKNLDVPEITTASYEVFNTISENDGIISITKKSAGSLTLSGYDKSKGSDSPVDQADTINVALAKLEQQIEADETDIENKVSELTKTVETNEEDIEKKVAELTSLVNTNEQDIEQKFSNLDSLVKENEEDIEQKFSNLDSLVKENEEDIEKKVLDLSASLQKQIDDNKNAISLLSNNSSEDLDSVVELIDWTVQHGEKAEEIISSINKESDERKQEDIALNKRIDDLSASAGSNITQDQIDTWNALETNVQSNWLATEGPAAILNKPINLVTEDDIVNMAVKSDLDGMVKTDSNFIYPEIKDKTDTVVSETTTFTIAALMQKIAELEMRIYALEHPDIKPVEPEPEPEPTPEPETPTPDEDIPEAEE